ncbi:hotdog fold thioesterase [Pseudonocardia alni]|uniref:hotdog fold thioesterase n=1 Tax=Pseudonocardia alni TaxID=33907 RepID=UPI0034066544
MTAAADGAPHVDSFAATLGIEVANAGGGFAEAGATVGPEHLNPHHTTHGAFLYSLAGVALAAAANDAEYSGVVSAVHIDYLRPSGQGDALVAVARVAERLPREDLFEIRVLRRTAGHEAAEIVARASGRATRRPR